MLVCLMIVLVGFLLWQVAALNRELQTLSKTYEPLERSLFELNEAGLRRRLAFERWYGILVSDLPRAEAISEARGKLREIQHRGRIRDQASAGIDHVVAEDCRRSPGTAADRGHARGSG